MSEYVYAGLTSQTIDLFIRDSSSTTGQGLSGLVFNSASLGASYRKGATGARTAITLATQTVGGAWSSGGFVEIDATNMKGVYRLDLPNAAVDTAGFVTVFLSGASNMMPVALRIDCRALPADVRQLLGTAWLTPAVAGTPDVNTKLAGGTAWGSGAITAAAIATDAVTEIQLGIATQASVDSVQTDTNDIQTRLPTALESGRIAAVLDSATAAKINKIEAVTTGTVTGAGTSTEVFVGPSATLTVTVDASGNRSAVVVT